MLSWSWIIFFDSGLNRLCSYCVVDLVEEVSIWVVLNFLNQFSNAGTLRVFHNGMCKFLNFEILVCIVHHYWFMTQVVVINNKFPESLTKCFVSNVELFVFMTITCWKTIWHIFCVCHTHEFPCSFMCLFNVGILTVFKWKCFDYTRSNNDEKN